MRRWFSSFAVVVSLTASSYAIDSVDFDRLFRAASGPSLPEPPSATEVPKPIPSGQPAPGQNSPLPSPHSSNDGRAAESIQTPAVTRELPRDQVDLSVLANPAPTFNSLAPSMIGDQELPAYPHASPNLAPPQPKEDRVDFNALFTSAQAPQGPAAACAPTQYYQPAVPLCMPVQPCPPAYPCTYCGPILGVPPASFAAYYQSPSCYRTLWATHAAERARYCTKHHTHMQGCCDCEQH